MSRRDTYKPGPADAARVQKDGDRWTLIVVKELRHDPEKVWDALTDPAQLKEWAPFDANRNLSQTGPITLTTVGMPDASVNETEVLKADAPHLLEFRWGDQNLRWQLEPTETGTMLTLWHNIEKNFISMGAAGWQICFDVMESNLDGDPIGRLVAGDALKFGDWQRLNKEYAAQFGIKTPDWEKS